MSVILLGDIHGDYRILQRAITKAFDLGATAVIQVGDFGLFPNNETYFDKVCQTNMPVFFIEGNHDDCTRWKNFNVPGMVFGNSNLHYIPRGSVLEIDGRTIAFMGGAASIDKGWRLQENQHWDENEEVTQDDVNRMLTNAEGKKIDMLLTHCPPDSIIEKYFDPLYKLNFGVSIDWIDPSQKYIETIWQSLGTPHVYSGHMHRYLETETATILDINQTLEV